MALGKDVSKVGLGVLISNTDVPSCSCFTAEVIGNRVALLLESRFWGSGVVGHGHVVTKRSLVLRRPGCCEDDLPRYLLSCVVQDDEQRDVRFIGEVVGSIIDSDDT